MYILLKPVLKSSKSLQSTASSIDQAGGSGSVTGGALQSNVGADVVDCVLDEIVMN